MTCERASLTVGYIWLYLNCYRGKPVDEQGARLGFNYRIPRRALTSQDVGGLLISLWEQASRHWGKNMVGLIIDPVSFVALSEDQYTRDIRSLMEEAGITGVSATDLTSYSARIVGLS